MNRREKVISDRGLSLSPEFLRLFQADRFTEVGFFGLDDLGDMFCELGPSETLNRNFAIYGFVGFCNGGKVLRIGESCDRPVKKRIMEYPRYINDARNPSLGKNGFFAGGTKPWERDGWFEYLRQFGVGLIYIKVIDFKEASCPDRKMLHSIQNALIAKYAPPFCNDSIASKPLRAAWEAINGKPQAHYKRPRRE